MGPNANVHVQIADALQSHGLPIARALLDAVNDIFSDIKLNAFSVADSDPNLVNTLVERKMPDELITHVVKWSTSSADATLLQQATYLSNVHAFAQSLASAHLLAVDVLAHKAMDKRQNSEAQIASLRETRARHAAFEVFKKDNAQLFSSGGAAVQAASRIAILDPVVQPGLIEPALVTESLSIQARFGESWTRDLTILNRLVEESCPNWQPYRETLLSNDAVVKTLLDNPKYGQIGKLTSTMQVQLDLLKKVHSDRLGALVPAALTKQSRELMDLGVETVAFTFFFFEVKVSWNNVVNLTVAQKNVEALRKELAPSNVVLTEEMRAHLKAWEDGDTLPDAVAARAAAA